MAVDWYDRPVRRCQASHPYSYDEFIVWRGGKNEEANGTVYTDRLRQWDNDKYDELRQKHFGDASHYWNNSKPRKIEAFLRDYMDDRGLRLIAVAQGCNQASGYPYWVFAYHAPSLAKQENKDGQ